MKRKWIGLVLAALLTFSLTACGGNTGGGGTNPGGVITEEWWSTTGELNKDDAGKVVFEDVEIRLTTVVNGVDRGAFDQIIAEFNAAYRNKINIVSTSMGEGSFESTVSQQIINNSNAPDLIMSHQKGHKSFADNKLIQPFDQAMETSGISIDLSKYAEGLASVSALGYTDRTFSIPIDARSLVVYYNKPLLEKYGGVLPTNRSELVDLCDRVAKGENIVPIAWDTSLTFFTRYLFPTAIVQNGGSLYNTENYRAEWDSASNLPAYKNAIASIRGLMKHTPALAEYAAGSTATLNNFLNNRALFYLDLPWNLNSIVSTYAARNSISVETAQADYIGGTSMAGWFAMDDNSANKDKIFGEAHCFAMSKTVTDINKKAAICEFMKWFTQTASVGVAWGEAGHVSVCQLVTDSEAYSQNAVVSNYLQNFYSGIDNFVFSGVTPYYSDMIGQIGALCAATINKDNDSGDESAIRSAMGEFNAIIDFINM